jgi:hypothetical protein
VHLFGAFTSLVRISVGFKLQTHEANLISYNATVFQSFSAYDYYVYSVNEAFVNHPGDNLTMIGPYPHIYSGYGPLPLDENVVEKLFNMTHDGELERLDKAQCIDAYAQIFPSSRGDVLLVTPNTTSDLNYTTSEPVIHYERFEVVAQSPYSWICGPSPLDDTLDYLCQPFLSAIRSNSTWQPFGREVEYCLSQRVEERCMIQYSVYIAIVVVAVGVIKTIVMLYVVLGVRDTPLITLGDAVCSFIKRPEVSTKGMCLCDVTDFQAGDTKIQGNNIWMTAPLAFASNTRRQFYAVGWTRWIILIFL